MAECSIGKRIADLRKDKGFTQSELADKLYVTDKAVSKWEKDNGRPSQDLLPKLANLFGVSTDYLLTGKDITQIKKQVSTQNNEINEETMLESCLENGIVIIDKLLDTNNLQFIIKIINDYPIHICELLYMQIANKQWKELFKFAIDYELNDLADTVIKRVSDDSNEGYDIEDMKKIIEQKFWKNSSYSQPENIKYLSEINKNYLSISNRSSYNYSCDNSFDIIQNIKKNLISDLSLKFEKLSSTKGITKEYLYEELNNNNLDMIVIKLCKKLEAILKCDYHYKGDFKTMLDNYISHFNIYDDESNDYDPYTPKMLNKLRKCRNSIVHSEEVSEDLTKEELIWLIDYVCQIEKN